MIYVVRHGETEWNAINKVLGRTDIPLNVNGMNQAQELARSMKDLKIDTFLCSPLLRTRQTAGIKYALEHNLFTEFCPQMVANAVDVLEQIIQEQSE